jgi:transcription initiation factor TFIIE subunit alpha
MLQKFLKEIVTLIAGKPAEEIVDLLDGNKYVNEFILAKKLNLTINQTRNILYKISDQGLVSFIRKKDKRKGWYTYFWKIEIFKSLEFLRNSLMKKMEQINYQIKSRETKEFYVCPNCNIEFSEESALIHNFTCNECGNIVSRKDNMSTIKEYNKELDKFKKELDLIDEELKIEKEKLEKIKTRESKKEEKLNNKEKERKKLERSKKSADKKAASKKSAVKSSTSKTKKSTVKVSKKSAIKKKQK